MLTFLEMGEKMKMTSFITLTTRTIIIQAKRLIVAEIDHFLSS